MKNNSATQLQQPLVMNEANFVNFPKAAQEVYLFLNKNKGKVLMPNKYYAAQKTLITVDLKQLFKKSPDFPPRDVAKFILSDLPDFIPPDKIIELTRFTLQTWQKMKKEAELTPA